MTLVSTVTVGSGGAASIDFTSIPQTGTDLLLICSFRENTAGVNSAWRLNLNGVSTNHTFRQLFGTGSSVASYSGSYNKLITTDATGTTSNTFSNNSIYIPNYAGSTNKSYSIDSVIENNASNIVDSDCNCRPS